MPCAAILRKSSKICVDSERIYYFSSRPKAAETGLEGGRENRWIVDNNPPDFNPFLLLLPSLGSSKFVQKLRILLGVSFHGYRVTEVDFEEMTI